MIKFLSLYLGLLTGIQPVEVVVANDVERVEIRLDGEAAATVSEAPWRARIDFGPRLVPRLLEAVAFDGTGNEVGRAEQVVNLPRPSSEAGIVLERDEKDQVRSARLSWQSVTRSEPLEVEAIFDGEALTLEDPRHIAIPAHDPKQFHVLTATLRFSGQDRVQAVASFGGAYLQEVSMQLTGVPVVFSSRAPKVEDLEGVVVKHGEPVRVVSIDKGQSEILFVRDMAANAAIIDLGRRGATGMSANTGGATETGVTSDTGATVNTTPVFTRSEQLRRMLPFDSNSRVRVMWPATARVERDEVRMDLFPASPPVTQEEGGIYWALTRKIVLAGISDVQRLTDAVAVAGLEAAAENRRRAVILVLGPDPEDESLYEAENVREYLRLLGVPLRVWWVGAPKKVAPPAGWSDVVRIDSLAELRRATQRVFKDLERQRILWVDGRHLPQSLELKPGADVQRAAR